MIKLDGQTTTTVLYKTEQYDSIDLTLNLKPKPYTQYQS